MHEQLFLSRRNLLALLAKLDRVAEGGDSACTIIKNDYMHPVFPATMTKIAVTAVEDEQYYRHREAGEVLGVDLLRSKIINDRVDAAIQNEGLFFAMNLEETLVNPNRGKSLYDHSTDNDPIVHSNRFPLWTELSQTERNEWNAKFDADTASEKKVDIPL